MAQYTVVTDDVKHNENFSLNYHDLKDKDWKEFFRTVLIATIVGAIVVIILKKTTILTKCYLTGTFMIVFFTTMLLFGKPFSKNVAILGLTSIILTIILSVFVFLTYDVFACKDVPGSQLDRSPIFHEPE